MPDLTDEEFLLWLEQQPDIRFPPEIVRRVELLLYGKESSPNSPFHLLQAPFSIVGLIRERMAERVAAKLQ